MEWPIVLLIVGLALTSPLWLGPVLVALLWLVIVLGFLVVLGLCIVFLPIIIIVFLVMLAMGKVKL